MNTPLGAHSSQHKVRYTSRTLLSVALFRGTIGVSAAELAMWKQRVLAGVAGTVLRHYLC